MKEDIFYNSLNLLYESDYKKLAKLKNEFSGWEAAWNSLKHKEVPRDPDKDWQKIEDLGLKLILQESNAYPRLLKEIPHPPFGIYVLGSLPPKEDITLAVVGTRKATLEGKELAKKFSGELGRRGIIIVSGLALGIDAAAHTGSLEARGKTIAVLGNGLDYIYPRTNERLAKKILEEDGVIISEYPPGTPPLPYRFLERNRIVSGLARGTLVIEAPENSGSLVTARFALDQNREVFVVPGPISHPNFRGSHQLIRAGAELVTRPEEILEALGMESAQESNEEKFLETAEEKVIFAALLKLSRPADVDKIIEITKLDTAKANQALAFLVIKNIVKETDEGYALN